MGHGVHSTRGTTLPFSCYSCSARSSSSVSLTQRQRPPSLGPSYVRYAVLGAGFAGLSVAWHLLKQSPKDSRIRIDIYDEVGIGGGASGVSGGLLHPYSPKAKLLWRAADCWNESLNLLSVAEAAAAAASAAQNPNEDDPLPIVRRREEYPSLGPSILSDAWLAVQGPRNLYMGSTWEWKSRNSSPNVCADEATEALNELLPKACAIFPALKDWSFAGARAGLRAMPPLTPHGSLPLLGCVNDIVGENRTSNYWLFGGLGSRGLLYHGWLGKLMAQAVLSCSEELIPDELTSCTQSYPSR